MSPETVWGLQKAETEKRRGERIGKEKKQGKEGSTQKCENWK